MGIALADGTLSWWGSAWERIGSDKLDVYLLYSICIHRHSMLDIQTNVVDS